MPKLTRRALTSGAAMASMAAMVGTARPQGLYPAGMTIKFVVPFVAGGVTDIVGRIVAERLAALWNVPTLVENVPGSGANIGNDRVAKGATDGSQILIMTPSFATNKFMYSRLSYDPEKDILPLAQVASSPNMLCVRKGLPVASVAEFIAYVCSPPPLGMAQRLDNLEDDRVAQRRIRHLELALTHHSLGQLARVELPISLQMAQANIGDLTLLEEAVADDVLSAFLLTALDQSH